VHDLGKLVSLEQRKLSMILHKDEFRRLATPHAALRQPATFREVVASATAGHYFREVVDHGGPPELVQPSHSVHHWRRRAKPVGSAVRPTARLRPRKGSADARG
jgi:hypothetical protein